MRNTTGCTCNNSTFCCQISKHWAESRVTLLDRQKRLERSWPHHNKRWRIFCLSFLFFDVPSKTDAVQAREPTTFAIRPAFVEFSGGFRSVSNILVEVRGNSVMLCMLRLTPNEVRLNYFWLKSGICSGFPFRWCKNTQADSSSLTCHAQKWWNNDIYLCVLKLNGFTGLTCSAQRHKI